jgi:small-conductance mechanosensitive channel
MKRKSAPKLVIILVILSIAILVSACGTEPAVPTLTAIVPTASESVEPQSTSAPTDESGGTTADGIAATVVSRTPVPTPTPGIIDREINNITTSLGLTGKTFLGLSVDDWFSLAFSVLIVVVGYFLGFRLLVWFLKWIAHRTSRKFDGSVLKNIEPDLKLLLLVFFTRFAVLRLDFLSDGLRTTADDLFFILELVIVSIIAIRLINFSINRYVGTVDTTDDADKLARIIKTVQRLGDFAVLVVAGSIGMSHFGVGTSPLAIALLICGVILYLGAKGIIADFVAGFIILLDQPYRINDAILIKELDTWGVVLEIGTRTTRIRTGDNREVIVPNSQINESQVINYTYPDPRFRVTTDIGVAYGSDLDQMYIVIEDTVRGVEGVLPDKPVDIFFLKFGDSTRTVRVRWWIDSYTKENPILDKVNAALETAFGQAGIDMPFDTYNLNVKMQDEKPDQGPQDNDQDNQVDSN